MKLSPKLAPTFHLSQALDSLSDNEMESMSSGLYGPSDMEATDLSMGATKNTATIRGNDIPERKFTPDLTDLNNIGESSQIRKVEKIVTPRIEKESITNPFVPGYVVLDKNHSTSSQTDIVTNMDTDDQPLDLTVTVDNPIIYYPPVHSLDDDHRNTVVDIFNRQTDPIHTEYPRMRSGNPMLQKSEPSIMQMPINSNLGSQLTVETNLPTGGARKKLRNDPTAKETPFKKEKPIKKSNITAAEQAKLSNHEILALYSGENQPQNMIQTLPMINPGAPTGLRRNIKREQLSLTTDMDLQTTAVLQANQGKVIINPAEILAGFDPLSPSTSMTARIQQTAALDRDPIVMNMRDDHFTAERNEQNNLNPLEGKKKSISNAGLSMIYTISCEVTS